MKRAIMLNPYEVSTWLAAAAPALSGAVAYLTYRVTRGRFRAELDQGADTRRAALFTDALQLGDSYRTAWLEACREVDELKQEVRALRVEVHDLIAEGERWRSAAYAARRDLGPNLPDWWPEGLDGEAPH